MTEEAKKWIKKNKLLGKKINYFDKEIYTEKEYRELYNKSDGSISGDGFVLFINNSSEKQTFDMYLMREKLESGIFSHWDELENKGLDTPLKKW